MPISLTDPFSAVVPQSGEPFAICDFVVGTVTSTVFGHLTGKTWLWEFVEPDHALEGLERGIGAADERFFAIDYLCCQCDPENEASEKLDQWCSNPVGVRKIKNGIHQTSIDT